MNYSLSCNFMNTPARMLQNADTEKSYISKDGYRE
jgi:hypothetical protein